MVGNSERFNEKRGRRNYSMSILLPACPTQLMEEHSYTVYISKSRQWWLISLQTAADEKIVRKCLEKIWNTSNIYATFFVCNTLVLIFCEQAWIAQYWMISPSKRVYNVFGLAARILERSHGGEYVEERGHLQIAFVLSTLNKYQQKSLLVSSTSIIRWLLKVSLCLRYVGFQFNWIIYWIELQHFNLNWIINCF